MDPEEYLYLSFLSRWERNAPPDGHDGLLDGVLTKNTQTARMVKVLRMLAGPDYQKLKTLERETKRSRGGGSYVSQDSNWMRNPSEIGKGWYFEGNMSLPDKKTILHDLPTWGLSTREFANCTEDFVEGRSVEKYWPSGEQAARQVEQWKKAYPDLFPGDGRWHIEGLK
jgi:hypothetical protein